MNTRKFFILFLLLTLLVGAVSCAASSPSVPDPSKTLPASKTTTEGTDDPSAAETAASPSSVPWVPKTPTDPETGSTASPTPSLPDFTEITVPRDDLFSLSPLWNSASLPTSGSDAVNVNEKRKTIDGHKIQIVNVSLELSAKALDAFETLNADFSDAYPGFSLLLVACRASDPDLLRCSRSNEEMIGHEVGFSVDLWYMTKKGGENVSVQPYDPSALEKTAFLAERASKLGVVPVFGGSPNDARHFRYVGLPHSVYMSEKKLGLGDYLDALGDHTEASPLEIYSDGTLYRVWSVPASDGDTVIRVPRDADCRVESTGSAFVVTSFAPADPPPSPASPEPTPSASASSSPLPSDKPVIYVDAGHGFLSKSGVMDCGAGENTAYFTLSEQTLGHGQYESDLNLQISLKVEKILKERGYSVIMSRTDYAYESLPVSDRAARAKAAGADLLVSVHANSAENTAACGARVYYNTSPDFPARDAAKKLADALCARINELCPSPTRSYPVDGSSLAMLRGTGPIPSALIETCFLTNEQDARNALDEVWQTNMATAIADGIENALA